MKRSHNQSGHGLMLLMVFLGTAVLTVTSLQMLHTNFAFSSRSLLDSGSAESIAQTAANLVKADILSKLDAGDTVDTSYTYNTTNITMPQDPTNLAGSTITIGSFSATLELANGNNYLIKVVTTVGTSSNVTYVPVEIRPTSSTRKGLRLLGRNGNAQFFQEAKAAGDVNGDGYDDMIAGSDGANGGGANSGEAYIIFGRPDLSWNALADANGDFDMANTSKTNKMIRFIGRNTYGTPGDEAGDSVAGGGDVDGDGYEDILIGAWGADGNGTNANDNRGEVYLFFGRPQAQWDSLTDANGNFNLDNLGVSANKATNKAVRFINKASGDAGCKVDMGDLNQDGKDDVIITARNAASGGTARGEVYVIYGRSQANWNTLSDANGDYSLTSLNKTNGITFKGRMDNDKAHYAHTGDADNDGEDDLLIISMLADGGGTDRGEAYLLFGRTQAEWDSVTDASGNFNLSRLGVAANKASNKAVRFMGRVDLDQMGYRGGITGDVNGDGFHEVVLNSELADTSASNSGEVYVIYGRSQANWNTLSDANGNYSLSSLNKANGLRFLGRNANDNLCASGGGQGGDINFDGYDDLIIAAPTADLGGSGSGETYLILGRPQAQWDSLTDANGDFNLTGISVANRIFRFIGQDSQDWSGEQAHAAGDVNNDGYVDFIIDSFGADGTAANPLTGSGEAYLIFGRSTYGWIQFTDANGDYNFDTPLI